MAEPLRQHWLIAGRVQGVGYRAWMVGRARAAAIEGWVRNLADGDVEAIVSGEAAALSQLLAACRQGPHHARVDRIDVSPVEAGSAAPAGFRAISGFRAIADGV